MVKLCHMTSQDRSLPTWWIKIWIALGCVAFAMFIGIPFFLSRNIKQEFDRYQACVEHRRADCQPSMIWLLSDWKFATSTSSGAATSTPASVLP